MQSNNNDHLGTESVPRLLIRLAIPAVISQLVTLIYNMVDRIYIGHIPGAGSLALTGLGVCMPAVMLISACANLGGTGGAPKASMFMGKKDIPSAEKTLGTCTLFLLLLAIGLTVVGLIFSTPILRLFGASTNTLPYARDYFNTYVLGTIFVELSMGLVAFITAQGFTTFSMRAILIGAVLNIILDPIFIFLLNMGIKGAALATILSQMCSCLWILYFLTKGRSILKIRRENLRLRREYLLPCISLGLSPFIMASTESLLSLCFNRSLLKYGGDVAVGSMTIFSTLNQMGYLPLMGICQGAQPITSYNYGAGNLRRVAQCFRCLLVINVTFAILFFFALKIRPDLMVGIFATGELKEYSIHMSRVFFAMMWIFSLQISCQQTFLALGNAKTSLFLAFLRKCILLIPLIFLLPMFFEDKVFAVFLAEPISDTIAALTTFGMFLYQNRRILWNCEPIS